MISLLLTLLVGCGEKDTDTASTEDSATQEAEE